MVLPEGVTDPYAVIGLPRPVLDQGYAKIDIRRAYRRQALALHPDKNPGDHDAAVKFNKLTLVFEFLSDDIKRKEYDETIFSKERQRARLIVMDGDRRRLAQELRRREEQYARDKTDTTSFLKKKFKSSGDPYERKNQNYNLYKQAEANRILLAEMKEKNDRAAAASKASDGAAAVEVDLDAFYILKVHWNENEVGMDTVIESEKNLRILLDKYQPFQILSCTPGCAQIQFLSEGLALKAAMNLSLIEFDDPELATCTVNPSILFSVRVVRKLREVRRVADDEQEDISDIEELVAKRTEQRMEGARSAPSIQGSILKRLGLQEKSATTEKASEKSLEELEEETLSELLRFVG